MPVHDTPTHELTSIKADKPYGCSNQPRQSGYWVMTRSYDDVGMYTMRPQFIHDRMSSMCRYDKAHKDQRCFGCKRPSDDNYFKEYGL